MNENSLNKRGVPKTLEVPLPKLYDLQAGDHIRSESVMYPLQIVRTDEKGVYAERTDEYQGKTKPEFIAWENLETDGFEKIPTMPESAPVKPDTSKLVEEAQKEYAWSWADLERAFTERYQDADRALIRRAGP